MEIIISILYYFRQAAKLFGGSEVFLGGNLDPFYLGAPLYVAQNYKDKKRMKNLLIIGVVFFLYGVFQVLFLKNINILKMVINITKIGVCIITMLFVIQNYNKVNVKKISKVVALLYAISIPIAFLFKSETIWRLNDIYNKYNLQRLELFYLEPSELGFHIVIILIMLTGYVLVCKDKKESKILIALIVSNAIVLYMARPMGAIVIGAFSIGIVLLSDLILNPSKRKIKLYGYMAIGALIVILYMIITKSSIYMRIIETLNGTDSSNSYRIGVTLDVLKQSLIDFNGVGCGFGNLNTDAFISKYNYLGLIVVVTNSFIYYIIEAGIFGIITLGILIYLLIKSCLKDRSPIKWGLVTFLLLYQIFAGHFTSGLTWALYGIVLSNFNEKDNFKLSFK